MISKSYRGRHRAPSKSTIRAAFVGMFTVGALTFAGGTASADPLDAISQCESGGNPKATNGTHFGLYQFDMSTWKSVGGKGNPMHASPGEQRSRAQALMAQRGTQPWNASKACWKGKGGKPKIRTADKKESDKSVIRQADKPAKKKAVTPKASAPQKGYVIQRGDTLGKLAKRHHTTVRDLMEKNPSIKNPNLIRAGATLRV